MSVPATGNAPLRDHWSACALAAIVGVLGVVSAHHPMLLSGLRRMQVDLGDTRFNNYMLEHAYRWSVGARNHAEFWNPPCFYPARNVAAYSDVLISVAPIYVAIRSVGIPPDTAFQLWMIACSALNYLAAFHLLHRRFRLGPPAACVGAFVFAFGAPRVNQLCHQQLLPQFMSLVTIDALIGLFDGRDAPARERALPWLVATLGVVAQLYCGFYLGYYLLLALGIVAVQALLWRPTRRSFLAVLGRDLGFIAISATVGCLLLYPLVTHYLVAAREMGHRYIPELRQFGVDWTTVFHRGPDCWLEGQPVASASLPPIAWEAEKRLGVGLVTTLAGALGLYWNRGMASVRLIAGAALVLLACIMAFPQDVVLNFTLLAELFVVTFVSREWRDRPRDQYLAIAIMIVAVRLDVLPGVRDVGSGLYALMFVLLDVYRCRDDPRRRILLGALGLGLALMLFVPYVLAVAAGYGMAIALSAWLLGVRPGSRAILVGASVTLLFAGLTTYANSPMAMVIAGLAPFVHAASRTTRHESPARSLLPLLIVALFATRVYRTADLGWIFLHMHLPGASALRAISRVGLMFLIAWALGIGLFIEAMVARRRPRVALGVGLACLLEQGVTTPSYDKHEHRRPVASLVRLIDRRDRAFYFSPHRATSPAWRYHLDAMWAELDSGVPTINGYSGNFPPRWSPLNDASIEEECDFLCLEFFLRRWAAQHHLPPEEIGWVGGPEEWRPRAESDTLTTHRSRSNP